MTLNDMCLAAARYSDRYDEFEKNEDDEYEDDALLYFNIFRDAINEAYTAISRSYAMPDIYEAITIGADKQIDLSSLEYPIFAVKDVLNSTRTSTVRYSFVTKYVLQIEESGFSVGDTVTIYYHYLPEPLQDYEDTPIFSEATADPMIYISLAVARIWMSEKKFEYANQWMQQYYMLLRDVKSSLVDRKNKRIPRSLWR